MRKGFIIASIVAVAVIAIATAAESRRPATAVATVAPIAILDLTLKAPQLPVQEVEDFSFVFTK